MPYKPPTPNSYTPIDPGLWPAVCVAVIDLGTSDDTYMGETKSRPKVAVGWEIHAEKEGKPVKELMWKIYTSSLHEKSTLRKHLESWRGRKFTNNELIEFDFYKMVGAPCLINVIHEVKDDSVRAKIESILTSKDKVDAEHPKWFFSFQDAELNMEVFNALPDFLKQIIERSFEWDYRKEDHKPPASQEEDDIPF